jgi:predicted transcriptional regulator
MIKPTKKQLLEIDFLTNFFGDSISITDLEISDYIERTVLGKKSNTNIYNETNKLFLKKRILDIQIKEWSKDIKEGILFYNELLADFNNHPYIVKVVKTMRKNAS